MNIKTTLKASVAAAALFAVAVPVAEAGTVSNSSKFDVSLSGQLNKAMFYYDNGKDSGVYQADNPGSQSRARIIASGKINEAMSVTATTEWSMTTSDESSLDPNDRTASTNGSEAGTDSFFTVRHNYLNFSHKQFGSVAIGHTSDATDGMAEFGGIGNIGFGTNNLFAGSVTLINSATDARATGTDVGAYRVSADGTRTSLIKYTTPSMGGFSLGVAHSNEQNTDVGAKFSGKFGGIGIKAGIGYKTVSASSTTQKSQVMGGVSVSHDSGLSADFNYSKLDMMTGQTRDPKSWSVGVNYKADLTSMGSTQFRVGYTKSEDGVAKGDELIGWHAGVEQGVADGVAVYAGWQNDDVSKTGNVNYDAVTTVYAGTKVVF